jgi:hypothetical protein
MSCQHSWLLIVWMITFKRHYQVSSIYSVCCIDDFYAYGSLIDAQGLLFIGPSGGFDYNNSSPAGIFTAKLSALLWYCDILEILFNLRKNAWFWMENVVILDEKKSSLMFNFLCYSMGLKCGTVSSYFKKCHKKFHTFVKMLAQSFTLESWKLIPHQIFILKIWDDSLKFPWNSMLWDINSNLFLMRLPNCLTLLLGWYHFYTLFDCKMVLSNFTSQTMSRHTHIVAKSIEYFIYFSI